MEMFRLSFGLGEFDVLRGAPSVTVVRLMFCAFVLTINVQVGTRVRELVNSVIPFVEGSVGVTGLLPNS